MQRPLVPILLAVIAGIVAGSLREIPNEWLLSGLAAALFGLLLSWRKERLPFLWASMAAAMFLTSVLAINLDLRPTPGPGHVGRHVRGEKIVLEGLVSAGPQVSPDKTSLTVSASRLLEKGESLPVEGKVLLNVVTGQSFRYGDVVRFRTKLKAIHNFNNPGGFDYERYLRYRRVLVRGFIDNPADIVLLRENRGNPLRLALEGFRADLKRVIRQHSPSPYGEIVQAMILGDQKEIPFDVMDKFNRTGTSHIIAISGFNVGIIALFSIFLFRAVMKSSETLLLKFNVRKLTTALSFFPVALFTFIAGMGVSVVRASLMALVFLAAVVLGKVRDLYNTLALAAVVILILSPSSLFDLSFQLSFTAVAAILFITPKLTVFLRKPDPGEPSRLARIAGRIRYDTLLFLSASVAATLGTLPLIVYYFNRVSAVSLPANLVVVPIMGILALPVCMAVILAAPLCPPLAVWLIGLSTWLMKISVALVDFFASLPGSSFPVVTPTRTEVAACYLLMTAGFALISLKKDPDRPEWEERMRTARKAGWIKMTLVLLLIFLLVSAASRTAADLRQESLRITAIDVGQGASTLVRLPGGGRMLIDGGGFYQNSFDIGRHVLAPYLWHEGIAALDVVVLTHVHPDHLNGLLFLLKNFPVGEVWMSGQRAESETCREFLNLIAAGRIPVRRISAETPPLSWNGVAATFFNPERPIGDGDGAEHYEDINNGSVVMKLTFGEVAILLPADISRPTEDRLVRAGADLRSQVLFAPHHGGRTSSTADFLGAVQPRIVVVSSGQENVFRDPHPEVLDRYAARGIRVFRTDRDGAVTLTTDGRAVQVDTFRGGRHPALRWPGDGEG